MKSSGFSGLLWCICLALAFPAPAADTFTVAIYYPQVPPYMYGTEDNTPQGVVPELLNRFFAAEPYRLQYVYENRYRAELGLYDGKYDATVLAEQWTRRPEALLFSAPILEHQDYLYSLAPLAADLQFGDSGKTICLRRHYIYSAFADELSRGKLVRMNAESEFDQFNMLVNKRCELVYMNENVASWLMNHYFADTPVYRQPVAADKTSLTLAIHPKWRELKLRLDNFIREAHNAGTIEHSLQQHMSKP